MSYADIRKKYGLSEGAQTPTADTQRQNTAGYTAIRKKYGLTEASAKTSREWYSKFDSAEMYEQAKKHTRESESNYVVSNDPVYTAPNIDLAQYDSPAAAVGAYAGQLISNALRGGDDDTGTWFQKGAFEDGYQFGDVTKTILASDADFKENFYSGVIGIGEKALDTLMYLAPYYAEGRFYQDGGGYNLTNENAFQQQNQWAKQAAVDFIAKDLYDEEAVAKAITTEQLKAVTGVDAETESVFGEKTDSLVQSSGQLAAQYGLQTVGIPWWVTSATTAFGSETENALNQGASYEEAGLSAAISAGAEILTEKLFSGDLFINKAGFDDVVKELTEGIANKFIKKATQFGLNSFGEGAEEWVSTRIGQFGQWLSYNHDEKTLLQMLYSEEALDEAMDSFFGGTVLGSGMGGIKAIASDSKLGTDTTVVDTANQTDYDNITRQGGQTYGQGEVGYRDDWGLPQRDGAERRTQGEGNGTQGGRILSEQGLSKGTSRSSVYSQGNRGTGSAVNYDSFDYHDGDAHVDNEGRAITPEIAAQLKGTTVVDVYGKPIMVYHGTPDMQFVDFGKGDTGFHFGTIDQAYKRLRDKKANRGRILQGYAVIYNPIFSETDLGRWDAEPFSMYLVSKGFISDAEYADVQSLLTGERNADRQYDAPAAVRLREILESKGYDGAIYSNFFEGDTLSYMVFRNSQFVRTETNEYRTESAEIQSDRAVLEQALGAVDAQSLNPRLRADVRAFQTHLKQLNTIESLRQQQQAKLQEQQVSGASTYELQKTENSIQKLDQLFARQEQKLQSLEQKPALQQVLTDARAKRAHSGNILDKEKNDGIINGTEMFRKSDKKGTRFKGISDARFESLTIEARKNGAIILRGTPEVERHLEKQGASAAAIGNILLFKTDICLSDVLEETYHLNQNLIHMNDDHGEPLRTILNEIDAKEYLMRVAPQYKIPRNELEHIKKQLESYKNQLQEYMKGG